MRRARRVVIAFAVSWLCGGSAWAAVDTVDMTLRDKTITLTIYRPAAPDAQALGVVFMAGGAEATTPPPLAVDYVVIIAAAKQYLRLPDRGRRLRRDRR